jgi:hypothetical protein
LDTWIPKNRLPDCEYCARSFVRNIERARSEGLVNRDFDAADPGTVHADMRNKVGAFVDDYNVHGLFDFNSVLFGGCNDPNCFLQCDY